MAIAGLDHVALPAGDPEALIAFYGALGFSVPDAEAWRHSQVPFFAVQCGEQKINFHAPPMWRNAEFTLRGPAAQPGCGDLCFVWAGAREELDRRLAAAGAEVVAGPMDMLGARGPGTSVYVRDPDRNLVEFIVYPD